MKKTIKSAVDGGWEVRSSDAWEALDMWLEANGGDKESVLEDLAQAMGYDELEENVDWIAQQYGVSEDIEDLEDVQDKYETLKEIMGAESLYDEMVRAMGTDELSEDLAFIFRMNDFREWDKYDDEITNSLSFVEKGNKIIAKNKSKIVGFIEKNRDGTYTYAFGKPSQSNYASFTVDDLETAKDRLEESENDYHNSVKSSRKSIKSGWERTDMASGPIWDKDNWRIIERRNHSLKDWGDEYYMLRDKSNLGAEDVRFNTLAEAMDFADSRNNVNSSRKPIKSSKTRHFTLKEIRDYVRMGMVTDITNWSTEDIQELGHLEEIGLSMGTYGMNGGLFQDDNGERYAVLARNANLFMLS